MTTLQLYISASCFSFLMGVLTTILCLRRK